MSKIKIILKNNLKDKNKTHRLKYKRGSELAQTVLITAIMVVIIATLFFPKIQALFGTGMQKLTQWFESMLNSL